MEPCPVSPHLPLNPLRAVHLSTVFIPSAFLHSVFFFNQIEPTARSCLLYVFMIHNQNAGNIGSRALFTYDVCTVFYERNTTDEMLNIVFNV